MTYEHRLTSKSQVTVPKDVRAALGIKPGGSVRFDIAASGTVTLTRAEDVEAAERRAKFREALEKWSGKYATGKSTEEQMRELRGEREI